MKFSGKMWLITILKVAKKQDFTCSLVNKFLQKPKEWAGEGVKLTPPGTSLSSIKDLGPYQTSTWSFLTKLVND